MRQILRTARGMLRSLRIYYGDAPRRAAMRQLYAHFLKSGDLAFDIGAHVGDRVAAFRALGARVVALEPQPALARLIRLLTAFDRNVTVVAAAVGRSAGTMELMLNIDNPTVSTLSADFVRAARGAAGWEGQAWTKTVQVPVVTLDELIARHGLPAFAKIDVEGYEAEALAGLSRPIPALSFEFTTIQRDVAAACIARCAALGYEKFDAALGESQSLLLGDWQSAEAISGWLAQLPHAANSGDIYAVRG
jgi:FkbM family methyltransferase